MRRLRDFKLEDVIQGKENVIPYEDMEIPGPEGPITATALRPKKKARRKWIPNRHSSLPRRRSLRREPVHRLVFAVDLIEELGAVCVTAEYRLAPEHPQPAQVEDSYAALKWMREHATELGFNPHKLIVCGGSAGGNLAAGVSLLARDRAGPEISGQVISSSWHTCTYTSKADEASERSRWPLTSDSPSGSTPRHLLKLSYVWVSI